MAFIDCHFFSETLGFNTSMYVILPQTAKGQIGVRSEAGDGRHPVLYLLHGRSDDHTIWLRRTSIERYVAPLGLAVVMPNVHRSFYTDMAEGSNYWTFISEELPAVARSFFPLAAERERNFVAGLSMGGYGALKLGLSRPESFAAAASLSGVADICDFANKERQQAEIRRIFGDPATLPGSRSDLFHLADELAARDVQKPRLYQCCGTEDFLYEGNVRLREHLRGAGLDLTYEEGPGAHEWGYWDTHIQRVLGWLPLSGA